MSRLNFHHLHYFWAVAKDGNLTRAAEKLHVSQSALSKQIRLLEEQLGQPLFARVGRTLKLTIFASGRELLALLREGRREERQVLRIGAVATLSRNFQENFIRPLLQRDDVELMLQSGNLADLLGRLRVHTLDLILSNRRVHASAEDPWRCRRIARQPVSLVGKPRPRRKAFRFPEELAEVPLLLPGLDNDIRAGFDLLCEQYGLRYRLRAEADDMALLRLLARDSDSVALVPTVVVQDELLSGRLVEYAVVPGLYESFFAISLQRRFEPPLLKSLLKQSEEAFLAPLASKSA